MISYACCPLPLCALAAILSISCCSFQNLLSVLAPILEKNRKSNRNRIEEGPKLQCLKCMQEFARYLGRESPDPAKEAPSFSEQGRWYGLKSLVAAGASHFDNGVWGLGMSL